MSFTSSLKGVGSENPYKPIWFWPLTVSVEVIFTGNADLYCLLKLYKLYSYIQGVLGGMCNTSGECSLC